LTSPSSFNKLLRMALHKALTIAGSDSGGGAGIQADLKTFAALGVYGSSVITAVTAQNTRQVSAIHVVPAPIVAAQIKAVLADIGADAIKTGMLANAEIIQVVVSTLQQFPRIPLVIDPVMVAKSGDSLLTEEAVQTLRGALLPLAEVVTPNIPEAEVLVGKSLQTEADFVAAARMIFEMGARNVVIKGGHRPPGRTESGLPVMVDLFYDGRQVRSIEGRFIDTPHTHGTGCTFASAIAAGLARGLDPFSAATEAREYLTEALRRAVQIGNGMSPVHHFHRWWSPAKDES
jgi:hydroxymethylpyrimidine/phosphomethylpyrimidine kinase